MGLCRCESGSQPTGPGTCNSAPRARLASPPALQALPKSCARVERARRCRGTEKELWSCPPWLRNPPITNYLLTNYNFSELGSFRRCQTISGSYKLNTMPPLAGDGLCVPWVRTTQGRRSSATASSASQKWCGQQPSAVADRRRRPKRVP